MERREVFEDAMVNLSKKEKDKAKSLRKRNTTRLTDILDRMTNIKFNTTWTQAKQMLLDNPAFADDDELLAMDKEDALIVFEDHIRKELIFMPRDKNMLNSLILSLLLVDLK